MRKSMIALSAALFLLSGCEGLDFSNSEKKDDTVAQKDAEQASPDKQPSTNEPIDNEQQEDNNKEPIVEEPIDDQFLLEAIFFNEVNEVDGKQVIQNPVNILALVNKQFALPGTYHPTDLVKPNVPFSFGNEENEKSLMRQEAATALEKMFLEAKMQGVELYAVSGYRSYERQRVLFDAEVNKSGQEKAAQVVAVPGNSEHQSGLAMDISAKSANLGLTEQFGETPEGVWLASNAHRFGFILRYPKGKETITGYQYEPWHFRFVGTKAAQMMYENSLTLEEYFQVVKKI